MIPRNILVLYKKTLWELYACDKACSSEKITKQQQLVFKRAHQKHYAALANVEQVLARLRLKYKKYSRAAKIQYDDFDCVITVGGDGTFLQAAKQIREQILIGVNSYPRLSVGRLCHANYSNFEQQIRRILDGTLKPVLVSRLRLTIDNSARSTVDFLNDILIAHRNPAAMSRYILQIGSNKEEQHSSGLWIATASGTTGAIGSAGGAVLPMQSKRFVYLPRELYRGSANFYRLTGGILASGTTVKVESRMRQGKIFIDGAHQTLDFSIGARALVQKSPVPIRTFIS